MKKNNGKKMWKKTKRERRRKFHNYLYRITLYGDTYLKVLELARTQHISPKQVVLNAIREKMQTENWREEVE